MMVYALVVALCGSLVALSFLVYDLYVQKSSIRCSILELRSRVESLESLLENKFKQNEVVEVKKKETKRKKKPNAKV